MVSIGRLKRGRGYAEGLKDVGREGEIFTAMDVWRRGIDGVMKEALERAGDGTDGIYVSLDIDVLDQTFAPGTSSPQLGGLSPREVLEAVGLLGRHEPVAALDLMEISPPFDIDGRTSRLGAAILLNFLCGLVVRKGSGRR